MTQNAGRTAQSVKEMIGHVLIWVLLVIFREINIYVQNVIPMHAMNVAEHRDIFMAVQCGRHPYRHNLTYM
jgi:hypothetical protein